MLGLPVVLLGVVEGVAVPEFGTQVTLNPPVVGCAPAGATVPTCEGAGVAACGCAAVVDGDETVGVGAVALTLLPVVPDCATVPVGHGFVPAPSPPAVGVVVLEVPVPAPGEVPGIAVVFMPGVWPGVVPEAVPGVTLGSVPVGGVVGVGAVVVVVWLPSVPAVAGVPAGAVGEVVVLMPGDAVVCPAVAGAPALVPALPAVPAVCATAHVPASSSVKNSSLRMQKSSAVKTDG